MHRVAGQILRIQVNGAAVAHHQADDHVKARRLAGPVRSEQADDLPAAHTQADVVYDGAGSVTLGEATRAENAHGVMRRKPKQTGAIISSSA
jgi:hypothetical protein